MPQSLRSILGKSNRVTKPTKSPLQRQTSGSPSPRKGKAKQTKEKDYFQDKLDDIGFAKLLEEDLSLRDVVQAMRFIRARMFSPVPLSGFHSSRMTELLNHRAQWPSLVTGGHLSAVLNSPTKVEREVAELLGKGVIRKIRVEKRGALGEALIEVSDLFSMLDRSDLSESTRDKFKAFLKENTTTQVLGRGVLTDDESDELVRAGFLTSSSASSVGTTLDLRPEDRTTLTSIERVSQFASGSISAVGGRNAIHLAGGGGGSQRPGGLQKQSSSGSYFDFRLAVPGHGRYMKLAEKSLDWVRETLGKTKWGEGPESWLKERFEGGGLYGMRWKEFSGLEWDWVIGEAAGLGVVELFETGSVGRGVRALG